MADSREVSVDLLSTAMELRAFLRAVHVSPLNAHGVLYLRSPQLDEAIRSYAHEFMPALAQQPSRLVHQLGRERAAANPGAISLENADHVADPARGDAQPRAGAGAGGVR